MFATLTLRALLPLGEPSPRIFRRPLTSPVACGHPRNGTIRRELIRTMPCDTARPTPPAFRPTTHPVDASAHHEKPRLRRLSTSSPGRTHTPEPLFHHPRKGVMQPRLGTPSTVPSDRLLSPAIRDALHSELNTEAPRTPFRSSFGHGPHQRGCSVEAVAIVWLSSLALRRCPCPTRDACDRFLPSAASISSTRASFAPDEVAASPERTLTVRPGRRR
jgi:hypothetical protein